MSTAQRELPAEAGMLMPLQPWPVVAGCHGGAGTSTVARLLEPAIDAGTALPDRAGAPLVLVARGNPHGTLRASATLESLGERGIVPAALVVVGDGPWPEPRLATLRLHQMQALVPVVVRVPYVAHWRYLDDPLVQGMPRRLARSLGQIVDAVRNAQGEVGLCL